MSHSALRRGLATGASMAVAAAGVVAFAPAASAVSDELVFDCTTLTGVKQFKTVADTDLPATVPFGKTLDVSSTAKVTVDAATRDTLYGFLEARTVEGTAVVKSTLNGTPLADITENVPVTPVPDSGELVVDASGPAPQFTASTLGANVIKVDTYRANLVFKKADGTQTLGSPMSIPCVAAAGTPGQDFTIDTVQVVQAVTTTTLAVVGDKATATVTSNGGAPVGAVDFLVGGQTVKAAVANGVATAKLPALAQGTHPVTATFVPTNAAGYKGSSATGSYVVTTPPPPAVQDTETTAKVKTKKSSVKVKVKVLNADGTPATGDVKLVLKKGSKKVGKANAALNGSGAAKHVFKKVKAKGKYKLVVKYTGSDASHASKTKVTFKKK